MAKKLPGCGLHDRRHQFASESYARVRDDLNARGAMELNDPPRVWPTSQGCELHIFFGARDVQNPLCAATAPTASFGSLSHDFSNRRDVTSAG